MLGVSFFAGACIFAGGLIFAGRVNFCWAGEFLLAGFVFSGPRFCWGLFSWPMFCWHYFVRGVILARGICAEGCLLRNIFCWGPISYGFVVQKMHSLFWCPQAS